MIGDHTQSGFPEQAKRLVEHEASLRSGATATDLWKLLIVEKLLPSLVPLIGKLGSSSLLARALALAKRETPELRDVRVVGNCNLEGLPEHATTALAILIGHLIGLLTTFMGETLTLRLLQNAWPELPKLQTGAADKVSYE